MRVSSPLSSISLTAAIAIALTVSAAAETVTFQGLETGGTGFTRIASYTESGYLFSSSTPDTGFAFWHTGNAQYSGSTTLWNWAAGGTTTLSKVGGGPFDILSMDLVELVRTPIAATSITFVGTKSDATTVTQTLSLDGVFGAQPFVFSSSFRGLNALTWGQGNGGAGTGHAFDNIVVTASAAPEPGSLALLLSVMGAVGTVLRRRKK